MSQDSDSPNWDLENAAVKTTFQPNQYGFHQHVSTSGQVDIHSSQIDHPFSQELLQKFNLLRQVPNLFQLLSDSIFINITANEQIKKSIVLALFGGTSKLDYECPGVFTRSDIHVLILGSRSSQKNLLLKSVTTLLDEKSCYIVGSSSSLKLIATNINKKGNTSDVSQPKGALICDEQKLICIDELEKMDKTQQQQVVIQSIEHQSIGVRDADEIFAFHPSKVTLVAAANLNTKEYNSEKLIHQNVSISRDLIVKFDLIYLVDDENANKRQLASGINLDELEYNNQIKRMRLCSASGGKASKFLSTNESNSLSSLAGLNQSGQDYEKIFQDESDHLLGLPFVRQYISYCSQYVHPEVEADMQNMLEDFVRHKMPLTTCIQSKLRVYETLARLAEAHARLYMRPNVTQEDLAIALDIYMDNLTITKSQIPKIKRNRKSKHLKPKDVYLVLLEGVKFFKKRIFSVQEIADLCLKFIGQECDSREIQAAIYSLNEQALLLKKQDAYEVL